MTRSLVCVVDDSADNRVLMVAVLERAGMDVVAVEDGRAMDEMLAGGRVPDLFILDLSLPGEDGTSILHRLRGDPRWVSRPVLACTAHAMLGDATRGLAAGFDGYLTKPVDVTQLAAVVSGYVVSGGKTGV